MGGRLVLLGRLLARDLRRRRGGTLLLLVAVAAATATLTLGLTLTESVERSYERTRVATAGPDLVVEPILSGPDALDALAPVATKPGVTAHSGPHPMVFSKMISGSDTVLVVVEGRRAAPPDPVDRPAVTDGTWVRPGGAVVERGLAAAVGVHVGDTITVDGRPLAVSGLAVTAARAAYPSAGWHAPGSINREGSGLIWVDSREIAALAGNRPLAYNLKLTVADPQADQGFAVLRLPSGEKDSTYRGWHITTPAMRLESAEDFDAPAHEALLVGSWLVTTLAIAGVAGIVAGRVIGQRRRVGVLKAVGAGPATIAAVHLAEYLVVGLAGAGLGLAAGWFAAPVLFRPAVGALGATGIELPSVRLAIAALVLALVIAITATLGQVLRAATTSTVDALSDATAEPRRQRAAIALSRRLPTALLLGVRINARRPRRARLVTVNTFITTAGLAAVLTGLAQEPDLDRPGYSDLRDDRLVQAMLLALALTCLLALLNTVVSTWTAALDTRHPLAVARALGATPGQAGAGLAVAQLLPALPGMILGIPFGIELYRFFGPDEAANPPVWWMAATGLAVLTMVTALTAVPALAAARRPVTDGLRSALT